jgi:hypothetical protein
MKNDFFIYLVTCQGLVFATLLYLLFTRDIPEPGLSSPSRLRILVNQWRRRHPATSQLSEDAATYGARMPSCPGIARVVQPELRDIAPPETSPQ